MALVLKNMPASAGDTWPQVWFLEDPPGKGNGNPLQYSCLKKSMDRGAWWATVYGIAKSQTRQTNSFTSLLKYRIVSEGHLFMNYCSEDIIM